MVIFNPDGQRPDTMDSISCGDEKLFYRIYSLPADARVDYQFIVDGTIVPDPRIPSLLQVDLDSFTMCNADVSIK